jgi:outer membrane murein-binding lipoprotein Lpp
MEISMSATVKAIIILICTTFYIAGCSSPLFPQQDSPEVQKQKARQAQQELAKEVQKIQ